MKQNITRHYGFTFSNPHKWHHLFSIKTTGEVNTSTILRIGNFQIANYCSHI